MLRVIDKLRKSNTFKGLLYILPATLILVVFKIYPIIKSFTMSFYTDFDYLSGEVYKRGLDNFQYVLSDPDFYLALKNTFYFVLGAVPLSIIVSLGFALLLNSNIKLNSFFRSIYFLPFVTSTAALAIIWRWIFNGDYGLANYLVISLGGKKIKWLTDPKLTIPILCKSIITFLHNLVYVF